MCGRFSQSKSLGEYQQRFGFPDQPAAFRPRFNLAPGQEALVVWAGEGGRCGAMLRWGLVPSWAREERVGYKMINARAEGLADKPAFRGPWRRGRCLVPAEGFYEWAPPSQGKQPYFLSRRDGEPFALAGLWDLWHDPEGGGELRSFTIITTTANDLVRPIHQRMPVMLLPGDETAWLDHGAPLAMLEGLLRPYPAGEMRSWPVSPQVNRPGSEGPELLEPVAAPGNLFTTGKEGP